MHRSRFFAIFQFLTPKILFGGLAPSGGLASIFPLSFGKSFMKIRSAVPENDCLIFMHYRCGGRKKQKNTNICKTYTHPAPPSGGGCVNQIGLWPYFGLYFSSTVWVKKSPHEVFRTNQSISQSIWSSKYSNSFSLKHEHSVFVLSFWHTHIHVEAYNNIIFKLHTWATCSALDSVDYTVWVKNPPRFSDIFPKWLGRCGPNFTGLLYVPISTLDYKFLFNYLLLWRSYAISATTQRAFRPMMDISSIWCELVARA